MNVNNLSDTFTRIRNASLVGHQIVQIPCTNINRKLSQLLIELNLINSVKELNGKTTNWLLLSLKYTGKTRQSVIRQIVQKSKPGLRKYVDSKNIPYVRGGFGIAIISTSKGLKTDRQARKEKLGGEVLCYIW